MWTDEFFSGALDGSFNAANVRRRTKMGNATEVLRDALNGLHFDGGFGDLPVTLEGAGEAIGKDGTIEDATSVDRIDKFHDIAGIFPGAVHEFAFDEFFAVGAVVVVVVAEEVSEEHAGEVDAFVAEVVAVSGRDNAHSGLNETKDGIPEEVCFLAEVIKGGREEVIDEDIFKGIQFEIFVFVIVDGGGVTGEEFHSLLLRVKEVAIDETVVKELNHGSVRFGIDVVKNILKDVAIAFDAEGAEHDEEGDRYFKGGEAKDDSVLSSALAIRFREDIEIDNLREESGAFGACFGNATDATLEGVNFFIGGFRIDGFDEHAIGGAAFLGDDDFFEATHDEVTALIEGTFT